MTEQTIYQVTVKELLEFTRDVALQAATAAIRNYQQETQSQYVTRREAAAIRKCSTRTIDNWIKAGVLDFRKVGSKVLIQRADLDGMKLYHLNK